MAAAPKVSYVSAYVYTACTSVSRHDLDIITVLLIEYFNIAV